MTRATFKDKWSPRVMVYNHGLYPQPRRHRQSAGAPSSRGPPSRSTCTIAKLTPVNGKVRLAASDLPFQTKGVAIETELCLPREADGRAATAAAASLFFAALPLLDTSKDGFTARS